MDHIQSIIDMGAHGAIVQIECHLSNSLPAIVIVGLGNKAVDEAKERVRSAFASTGLQLPRKRITINLAPADIQKDSTSLDLAIAMAIMHVSDQTPVQPSPKSAFVGEVGLDGTIRPVRGIIGKLVAGRTLGITHFFVPAGNAQQALLVPDIHITAVESLKKLSGAPSESPNYEVQRSGLRIRKKTVRYAHSLNDVVGQTHAKRGLEIAAAGGHNILLSGPPGVGKSMLAKALPELLPPMDHQEILEVTHLHSLASNDYERITLERPFRAPHHSSSYVSIVGGGAMAKPGEISLSHRGVLFLDEMPEFLRSTLEALRQPLEEGNVVISRARHTVTYPADFILIGTANPCPCGYYGTEKQCDCTAQQILHYQQKISGPILDRIDLHLTMSNIKHSQLLNSSGNHDDALIRKRITAARDRQRNRYDNPGTLNATMSNRDIRRKAFLRQNALDLLNKAAQTMSLSARSYMRTIKIARTIADVEASAHIEIGHISEALQYRPVSQIKL